MTRIDPKQPGETQAQYDARVHSDVRDGREVRSGYPVNDAFLLGQRDAAAGKPQDNSQVPSESRGAYDQGYTHKV